MFDSELMEAVLDSYPKQREKGEGITAQEIKQTSPLSLNAIRRRLKEAGLKDVWMVDFDGIKRKVFIKEE